MPGSCGCWVSALPATTTVVCSTLFASLKGIIRIVIKGNKPVVGLEYSSKKNECGIHIIKGWIE